MFHYAVVIKGLEKIPLRTTTEGASDLISAFHNEAAFIPMLIEQINRGTPFKNGFIQVSRIVEDDSPPVVNFAESLAKVKAKFLPLKKKAVKKAVAVPVPAVAKKAAKKAALKRKVKKWQK